MHCGGRTEAPADSEELETEMAEVEGAPEPQPHDWDEEQPEQPTSTWGRLAAKSGAIVWLLFALATVLARAC
jgi:hypothetical protein